MRQEYFTITELSRLMNISHDTLLRRINTEGYFTAVSVGLGEYNRRLIIDKKKFFDWFWRVYHNRVIYEMFPASNIDIDAIKESYAEFVEWSRTKYHQDVQYKIDYITKRRRARNARHERKEIAAHDA